MIKEIEVNGDKYYCCKDICDYIGLSKYKRDNEIKKLKREIIFEDSIITSYADTNGGRQKCIFLKYNLISIWLYKMNSSLLNEIQMKNINKLLIEFGNEHIFIKGDELDYYEYESKLRDEIYDIGWFNDIKIIEKEKIYDFGRIDLYGIDSNNKKVCIELKKKNCFGNTKEQLLKYKDSGCFNKIIYCALSIDDDLLEWLKDNDIIPYVYKRQLVLSEVC